MKITKTSREIYNAGMSFDFDDCKEQILTESFATDRRGLPYQVTIRVAYAVDYDADSILDGAREFIHALEQNKDQIELEINKVTGEIK